MSRWSTQGIQIGSLNIRGFTYLKLLLLLEQEHVDILCLQETWISEGTAAPVLEGFALVEQRRPDSTRGGIATFVRKPLQIESTQGNEYGLHTKIILPNSLRINIVNTYIPPKTSLAKRHILEADATTLIELLLDTLQPQLTTFICGDFNTRTGTKIPDLECEHPPRDSVDSHVCQRAKWLLKLCETY